MEVSVELVISIMVVIVGLVGAYYGIHSKVQTIRNDIQELRDSSGIHYKSFASRQVATGVTDEKVSREWEIMKQFRANMYRAMDKQADFHNDMLRRIDAGKELDSRILETLNKLNVSMDTNNTVLTQLRLDLKGRNNLK